MQEGGERAQTMTTSRLPIFQERFKALRGNMTQGQFAEKLGISRPTVGLYESGARIPDAEVLRNIAEKCNVTSDWLLGIEDCFTKREAPAEDAKMARATYEKMLRYAIEGCRHLIWQTAFDLNRPFLSAGQAQEIVYNLGQMANDLDSYEAEAERLGLGK